MSPIPQPRTTQHQGCFLQPTVLPCRKERAKWTSDFLSLWDATWEAYFCCASPRGLKELAWLNCRGEGGSYKHRKGWGSQLLVQGSQQLACDSLAEDLPVHGSWHQPHPPCTLAPELSTHGPLHLTCPLIVPGIEPVWTPPARPPAFFSNHPTRTD